MCLHTILRVHASNACCVLHDAAMVACGCHDCGMNSCAYETQRDANALQYAEEPSVHSNGAPELLTGGVLIQGGKIDDITVLVAVVTEEDTPPEVQDNSAADDAADTREGTNRSSRSETEQSGASGPQD